MDSEDRKGPSSPKARGHCEAQPFTGFPLPLQEPLPEMLHNRQAPALSRALCTGPKAVVCPTAAWRGSV